MLISLNHQGVPHLLSKRPPETGSGIERFNVADLGLGKLEYDAQGVAQLWSSVMEAPDSSLASSEGRAKGAAGAGVGAAAGLILVATEEEICVGGAEHEVARRVEAAARRAQDAGAAGLLVVMSAGAVRSAPRSWAEGDLKIPVLAMVLGDDGGNLTEVVVKGGVPLGRYAYPKP